VKLTRTGGGTIGVKAASIAALIAGSLALAACGSSGSAGSDDSSDGGSTSASTAAVTCASGSLKGEGSSAQTNAITQWITDYQTKCSGATVAYNPTGSGAGRKNFIAGQVDFAGSDAALSAAELPTAATRCGGAPAIDLPMVVGPISIAYKLNGVKDLTLTASLVANIFQGKITKWNDAAIKTANPKATLPSTDIKVFFRSDDSGTTQNFETYLAAAAPADYTATPAQKWSGSVGEGKTGSAGVQQGVQATEGGIGYMEYSFAQNGNLSSAKIDTGSGTGVELNDVSAGKAVASATVVGTGADLALKLDYATKAAGAYPIVLVTYEVVCTKGLAASQSALVKSFLTYVAGAGQKSLVSLGYAPLPAELLTKVQAAVAALS
jgi:phosphate transport system substrate-binding protein